MYLNLSKEEIKKRRDLQSIVCSNISRIIVFRGKYQENRDFEKQIMIENAMTIAQKDIYSFNAYDIEILEKAVEIIAKWETMENTQS